MARKPGVKCGTFVALLRGVNVGGKNKLPMKLLSELLGKSGCGDVRTYIQSGNAVFRADPDQARRLEHEVPALIQRAVGFAPPVVVRSASDMAAVVKNSPFPTQGENGPHVLILSTRPSQAQIAALDPMRSPGDRFVVRDREIYLLIPGSIADTKLTNAYFDSKLGTVSTGRNWRTVLTLLDMARSL